MLLIVAGPGAGKTKTLIHRIAFLLAQGLAEPREILAVTFSVRAASELRLRLAELLGEQPAAQVSAATFHSICARLLREHAQLFGRARQLDGVRPGRGPQGGRLAALRPPAHRDPTGARRLRAARRERGAARDLAGQEPAARPPTATSKQPRHPAAPLIAAVWRETEAELRRSNAMDFDDLLVCAVRLLAEHPHYLELYRRRWPWILVDEYQDTCQAQAVLVSLLARRGRQPVPSSPTTTRRCTRSAGADAHGLARLAERFPAHERIVLGAQLPLARRDPVARPPGRSSTTPTGSRRR